MPVYASLVGGYLRFKNSIHPFDENSIWQFILLELLLGMVQAPCLPLRKPPALSSRTHRHVFPADEKSRCCRLYAGQSVQRLVRCRFLRGRAVSQFSRG